MKTRVVNLRHEAYDVYIGRPSFWGNPIRLQREDDRQNVLEEYTEWLLTTEEGAKRLARLSELRGKRLGCFCAPKLCHGDVLARLAEYAD